ncbi:MAG: nitroreductase family protein [Muribaculaceae bacterium]|nr:nitroreductase family protein [Muribaculaceae bacterium]
MENLHQLMLQRHSIRRYKDQPVSADDVKTILEAALLAPSSKSARPWQFVVVEDKDMLTRLADCKQFGTKPVSTAAFAVVVTVDPAKSDVYVEDATVAAIFMHLQAADLGLGSCWIQVRGRFAADGESSETVVRELLDIPEEMAVECIVTFGYIDEQRRPVDPEKLLWEKVHIGRW